MTREDQIEAMCAAFVGEAVDVFPFEVWPDRHGDDGYRGEGSYVRLMDPNTQEAVRSAMGFALDALLAATSETKGLEQQ